MRSLPSATARTILIVEDEPGILEILEEILTDEGYVVVVAPNGADGLLATRTQSFDLILLDLHMPQLGGAEFCRLYHEQGGVVPIILSTAVNPSEAEAAVIAYDAAGYIQKPFNLDDVVRTVAQHLL